jgi:YggT family protein
MLDALYVVFIIATNIILGMLFVWAVLSWLINFDVVNTRNRFVATVWGTLDRLMRPLTGWIPRQIRVLGGVDIGAIILFLIIIFLQVLVRNLMLGRYLY